MYKNKCRQQRSLHNFIDYKIINSKVKVLSMNGKFVASYSGGKDSALAIYKAMKQGFSPVSIIITYNTDRERSWFHGIPENILKDISESLNIPVWKVKTKGSQYNINFEKALSEAKNLGAETCVFGDIDIEAHRKWCEERCKNVGLMSMLPLWGMERKAVVEEFIDAGFKACFTIIDVKRMRDEYLGKILTKELLLKLSEEGTDVCGENGEYHTFVYDGPIFNYPVQYHFAEKITENGYSILPIE